MPKSNSKKNNFHLPAFTLAFSLFGLSVLATSSHAESLATFQNPFHFIQRQIIWFIIAFFSFLISTFLPLKLVKKMASPLFLLGLLLLFLVLIPGFSQTILGARRWLKLGPLYIQPTEIIKFSLVLYLAQLFSKTSNVNIKNLALILIPPSLLIMLEPDLGTTAIIVFIALTLFFLAQGNVIHLLSFALLSSLLAALFVITSPYRLARLNTLVAPQQDPLGKSYHANQLILALGSGGLFGKGFGNSSQKYQYLPEVSTDSIMAVVGEEFGFIGLFVFIFAFMLFIGKIFTIAKDKTDPFDQLLVSGAGIWIAIQGLTNLAAVAIMIPITGVPFPLVSYGGSSLFVLLTMLGLVYNIERNS
jgi:cell division protein FtsW